MKLIASLIVHNELDRYLPLAIASLLEFCDAVAILDDASTDGTSNWLTSGWVNPNRVRVMRTHQPEFFSHEGRARQRLLDWTLRQEPTHILAIDADEFIADGQEIRRACSGSGDVWTLVMEEVWELDGDCICIREDGGWKPHPIPNLYRVPSSARNGSWRIADRALACGREPTAVRQLAQKVARPSGTEILHFGWANVPERQARYDRYAVADGGRFHASAHLQSIMWDDDRVHLEGRTWPTGLLTIRDELTERVNRPEYPDAA